MKKPNERLKSSGVKRTQAVAEQAGTGGVSPMALAFEAVTGRRRFFGSVCPSCAASGIKAVNLDIDVAFSTTSL